MSPLPQKEQGGGGPARELPGHIRKAFRSIERFLPVVDIILELLDARMPRSSRLPGFVKKLEKKSIVILGKSDLADPVANEQWKQWFEKQKQPCVVFRTDDITTGKHLLEKIQEIFHKKARSSTRKICRLMVIGIPNVGKSTLINSLAGRRAARVANLPGVTRSIQWIKLSGELELLDLPGILDFSLLKKGNVLRLINTLPGPSDDPESIAASLLKAIHEVSLSHKIPGLVESEGDLEKFLAGYARQRKFVLKGSEPDLRRASIDFVKKFQAGGFGQLTLEYPELPDGAKETGVGFPKHSPRAPGGEG